MNKTLWILMMTVLGLVACGDSTTGWVPPAGPGTEGQASGVVLEESASGEYPVPNTDPVAYCSFTLIKRLQGSDGYLSVGNTAIFELEILADAEDPDCYQLFEIDQNGRLVIAPMRVIDPLDRTMVDVAGVTLHTGRGTAAVDRSDVVVWDARPVWQGEDGVLVGADSLIIEAPLIGQCTPSQEQQSSRLAESGLAALGTWSDYNVVLTGNLNGKNSDIEGRVAVYLDVDLLAYGINVIHRVQPDSGVTTAGTALMYGGHLTTDKVQFWGDVFSAVNPFTETLQQTATMVQSTIVDGTSTKVKAIDQAAFDQEFAANFLAADALHQALLANHAAATNVVECVRDDADYGSDTPHTVVCDASLVTDGLVYFDLDATRMEPLPITVDDGSGGTVAQNVYVEEVVFVVPDVTALPTMQILLHGEPTNVEFRGGIQVLDPMGGRAEPVDAATRMLWVLDGVPRLTVLSAGWPGSLLALRVELVSNNTLFMGQVFAHSLQGWVWNAEGVQQYDEFGVPLLGPSDAQFNWVPFAGDLNDDEQDSGLCRNTACAANVCATVQFEVAPGEIPETPMALYSLGYGRATPDYGDIERITYLMNGQPRGEFNLPAEYRLNWLEPKHTMGTIAVSDGGLVFISVPVEYSENGMPAGSFVYDSATRSGRLFVDGGDNPSFITDSTTQNGQIVVAHRRPVDGQAYVSWLAENGSIDHSVLLQMNGGSAMPCVVDTVVATTEDGTLYFVGSYNSLSCGDAPEALAVWDADGNPINGIGLSCEPRDAVILNDYLFVVANCMDQAWVGRFQISTGEWFADWTQFGPNSRYTGIALDGQGGLVMSGFYDDADWNGAALPAMLTYQEDLTRTGFVALPTTPPMTRRLIEKVFIALTEALISPAHAVASEPPVQTFACDVVHFGESIWVAGGQRVIPDYAPAHLMLWQDGSWVYNLPPVISHPGEVPVEQQYFLDFAVAPALPPLPES